MYISACLLSLILARPASGKNFSPFTSAITRNGHSYKTDTQLTLKTNCLIAYWRAYGQTNNQAAYENQNTDQRRLAKTDWSRDEGQFVTKLETLVESIEQLGAADEVRP